MSKPNLPEQAGSPTLADFESTPVSARLEEITVQISRGEAPNSGRFCGNCYTPMGAERESCSYCGVSAAEREPADRIPPEVFDIVRAKRKRESLIVNSLAFAGLALGTVVAIIVAIFVVLPGWATAVLFIVVLLVAGRGLAALLGGWYGDSVGYRSAQRLVRERWDAFVASRDDLGKNHELTR